MLNLKETHPTQWLQSLQKIIKNTMLFKERMKSNLTLLSCCLLVNLLFSSFAQASYAAQIQNPNDGYRITLASNSQLSNPIVGSDGKNYYRIGNPIVVNLNSPSVSMTGSVNCMGRRWGNSVYYLPAENTFHRLFIYAPLTGMSLEGRAAYRVNQNLIMTVDSRMISWIKISESTSCSDQFTGIQPINGFSAQFPITVTFYIHDRIVDGLVSIPSMEFGGYVRAFTSPNVAPEFNSWPIGETTAPMRLVSSTLNIAASCNTTNSSTGLTNTINLRHGQLSTLNYNSTVTERVTYNCKFSMPTTVRLRLDYASDGDPQKRLPMISSQNSNNKIYSDLTMTDETTGQTGKDFKIDIKDLRTIMISSHIQGTNAAVGDYKGSAWLIATFD